MILVTVYSLPRLNAWHWADEWERETIYLGRSPEEAERVFADSHALDTATPVMGQPYRVTSLSCE